MSDAPRSAGDAVSLGRLLAHQRLTLGISLDDASRHLLLSKSQIEGLERGDPAAFYNPQFYRQALRKFAAYVNVALPEEPTVADLPAPVLAPPPPPTQFEPPSRVPVYLTIAALLLVVVGGAGWLLARSGGGEATSEAAALAAVRVTTIPADVRAEIPAAPAAPPAAPGLSLDVPQEQQESAAAPATPTAVVEPASASAVGMLTVDDPSWVFVRYVDGSVVQRGINPGEQLALTQRVVYLAAGTRTVHVTVADRMIDTRPFVTDKGEVRVSARQLEGWPFPDVPPAVPVTASTP